MHNMNILLVIMSVCYMMHLLDLPGIWIEYEQTYIQVQTGCTAQPCFSCFALINL